MNRLVLSFLPTVVWCNKTTPVIRPVVKTVPVSYFDAMELEIRNRGCSFSLLAYLINILGSEPLGVTSVSFCRRFSLSLEASVWHICAKTDVRLGQYFTYYKEVTRYSKNVCGGVGGNVLSVI